MRESWTLLSISRSIEQHHKGLEQAGQISQNSWTAERRGLRSRVLVISSRGTQKCWKQVIWTRSLDPQLILTTHQKIYNVSPNRNFPRLLGQPSSEDQSGNKCPLNYPFGRGISMELMPTLKRRLFKSSSQRLSRTFFVWTRQRLIWRR